MPNSISERIYYKLPLFMQNSIFSIYCLSESKKRYNYFFYSRFQELKDSEWWSKKEIENYKNINFAKIVKHAYETVPFYKDFYDKHGVNIKQIQLISDLKNIPILTKKVVRENQLSLISNKYKKKQLHRGLTSGTSGTPLCIYKTSEALAFQWAIWWRHKSRFGLKLKDRQLMFGARVPIDQTHVSSPYWRNDYFNNRVYLSTYHISKNTVGDIVSYLNNTDFKFYTGYPSAIYNLAFLIKNLEIDLQRKPEYIVCGSDALLPKHERLIHEVFDAPVTEQYGMAEFSGNMSKCEHGLFHEDFECGHIETQSMDDSNTEKLLLTGWGNYAMPFIRYDVGDYAKRSNKPCKCGRESSHFTSLDGRLEDYIITPDGRKIIGMNQVFEYAKHAKEIQLYQKSINEVEFKIIPGRDFNHSDQQALMREFKRRAGSDMKIQFSLVDKLIYSNTGKLKAVISNINYS